MADLYVVCVLEDRLESLYAQYRFDIPRRAVATRPARTAFGLYVLYVHENNSFFFLKITSSDV